MVSFKKIWLLMTRYDRKLTENDEIFSSESIIWNESRFEIISTFYGDFYVEL